jgi:hypothetical protein
LGTSIYTTCIDFHKFSCSQQMTNNWNWPRPLLLLHRTV